MKRLIYIVLILFTTVELKATHSVGADLTYKCTGVPNEYEVTLTFYYDCGGTANPPNNVRINFDNTCNGIGTDFFRSFPRVVGTGQEITPICATMSTTCSGGVFPGIQEYVYRGVVTLNAACSDWVASYQLCCRNGLITNVNNPLGQNLYVEAHIDNTIGVCNSSPEFSNPPVPFVCRNQAFCFNHGPVDPDGDSLVYSLIDPLDNVGNPIPYNPGFSKTNPLTSSPVMSFNALTGDICMTPTNAEVTIVAMLVEEYRNGVKIGSVMRDIQINVIDCGGNNTPFITGFDGNPPGAGNTDSTVCAGTPLNLTIGSFDLDAGQNVSMSWNNGVPGATFNITGPPYPIGMFGWTPIPADVSTIPYCFSVTVRDNNCPFYASFTQTYCITVNDINIDVQGSASVNCGDTVDAWVQATSGTAPYTYLWSNGSTNDSIRATCGTYYVDVSDATGCGSVTDSVVISCPTNPLISMPAVTNISCFGSDDGTATFTPTGGTAPYWYMWSNGDTSQLADSLPPGIVNVTFGDATSCSNDTTFTIVEPTEFNISSSVVNLLCYGDADGTGNLTVSGAVAPYTHSWSNGQTIEDPLGLTAGTHYDTIRDFNGCDTIYEITITQPTPINPRLNIVDVSCFGAKNGIIRTFPIGGTPPYTHNWSNGEPYYSIGNLYAGIYSDTIRDFNGCDTIATGTIGSPAPISTIENPIHVFCAGFCTGGGNITPSGGTGPYSYYWNEGAETTDTIMNKCDGDFPYRVTDSKGCNYNDTLTILSNISINIIPSSVTSSCNGSCDGEAVAQALGGTDPYIYVWSQGTNNDTVTSLCPGWTTVTVTDNNLCTESDSIFIDVITTTYQLNDSTIHSSCKSSDDAEIHVIATNGVRPYTYLWNTGSTDSSISNLSPGMYKVYVTESSIGTCLDSMQILITEPDTLLIVVDTVINASCKDSSDGAASVFVSGGTPIYSYLWSSGSDSSSEKGLIAGTYKVFVTDINNCIDSTFVTISDPFALMLEMDSIPVSCNGISDGIAIANASGGTYPYYYFWNDPSLQVQDTAVGLSVGTYIITLVDSLNCRNIDSVEVTEPTILQLTTDSIDALCYGGFTGTAIVSASGGTSPYFYNWKNGQSTDTATGLPAGIDSVWVTDANGCVEAAQVIIVEPFRLSAITDSTEVLCNGDSTGTATIIPSGGIGGYTYLWSDGQTDSIAVNLWADTHTVRVTDANLCFLDTFIKVTQPLELTASIDLKVDVVCFGYNNGELVVTSGGGTLPVNHYWTHNGDTTINSDSLFAGIYTVELTDANGCFASVTETIDEPTQLQATTTVTDVSCYSFSDGSIVNEAFQATPINAGWGYVHNVYDSATASLIYSGMDSLFRNLPSGIYYDSIRDFFDCELNLRIEVTQPDTLQFVSDTTVDANCFNANTGWAKVIFIGGSGAYTYNWSNGQFTDSIINLGDGKYTVTVSDINGCTDTTSVIINEPNQIVVSMNNLGVELCPGDQDSLSLSVSGGNGVYTYNWNNTLSDTNAHVVAPLITTTYVVSVSDSNGCTGGLNTDSVEVFVRNLDTNRLTVYPVWNICTGDSVILRATYDEDYGGNQYVWSHGFIGLGPDTVYPVDTTTYTLSIIDVCNDTLDTTLLVEVYTSPIVNQIPLDGSGCPPYSVTFENLASNAGDLSYFWDFGDGSTSTTEKPVHVFNSVLGETFEVNLTVTAGFGDSTNRTTCVVNSDTSSQIIIYPNPMASFRIQPEVIDKRDPVANFINKSAYGDIYYWDYDDGFLDTTTGENVSHTYKDTGDYYPVVIIGNTYGCWDTIELYVRIDPFYSVVLPNAFTPSLSGGSGGSFNGLGDNSVFHPHTEGVEEYELMVFNRWGELIFASDDVNIGWDGYYLGELCKQDVYVWKLHLKWADGTEESLTGDVTLLR